MTIYAIGADYANAETSLTQIVAHGGKFVCRYASTPGNPKNLTEPELRRIRIAGLTVVSVFETTAARAASGHPSGLEDGAAGRAQHAALGLPVNRPMYFTVDFQPTENEMPAVGRYFHGLREVQPGSPVGCYGGYDTCAYLLEQKLVDYVWQTYAWSGGRWLDAATLRQVQNGANWGGFLVDVDEAHAADYGQWPFAGQLTPGPVPTPTNWTETMITTLPNVREGDRDPTQGRSLIRRVQAVLKDVGGYGALAVDGDFGPHTNDAVRGYQGTHGLAVDGIVGPHTWARLLVDETL